MSDMSDQPHADLMDQLRPRATAAAQAWQPGVEVTDVRPLTGGTSSLTFVATVTGGHEPFVLKVAPPGLPPVKNRDVLRQGKLMRGLHGRPGVVVPEVLFECEAESLEVPPFVAMSFVQGECLEPILEKDRRPEMFDEYRARAFDAARVLAAMHRVDPGEAGLGDEPVVTPDDEIQRWYNAFETLPDDLRGDYKTAARVLRDTMPEGTRPVVNHGDYRLGNTLCKDGCVTAVIDWEIWSVGDPRVDTTWFTYFTDEAGHPSNWNASGPSGMPTQQELLDCYADAGGGTLDRLDWFHGLTRYKEAAATALLVKRARKLAADGGEMMARIIPALFTMVEESMEFARR